MFGVIGVAGAHFQKPVVKGQDGGTEHALVLQELNVMVLTLVRHDAMYSHVHV